MNRLCYAGGNANELVIDALLVQLVRRLYLEHGWPDAFRKEEYLRAAQGQGVQDDYHWLAGRSGVGAAQVLLELKAAKSRD